MTEEIFVNDNPLQFVPGFPALYNGLTLPNALVQHAFGPWGSICVQEIRGECFLLRHFIIKVNKLLKIETRERGEGLQSLISLQGEMDYSIKGMPKLSFRESHFHLFNAHHASATLHIGEGKSCTLFNTYYKHDIYKGLLRFFPSFKKGLRKADKRPFLFTTTPKAIRYSIHDAIQDIWLDRYLPVVQQKYIELRLQTSLFSLLADSYAPPLHSKATAFEREKADAARDFMLQNIKRHFTAEEIALQVYCSPSWLKKAFSKVYGMGPFHFLRQHRMHKAKEMLLRGESLKAVAIEVGMKPRNFPKEFKSFFGYTVTELKKGIRQ